MVTHEFPRALRSALARRGFGLFCLFAAIGCGIIDPKDYPVADNGMERGLCYSDGTCNDGLVCLSGRCFPPPGHGGFGGVIGNGGFGGVIGNGGFGGVIGNGGSGGVIGNGGSGGVIGSGGIAGSTGGIPIGCGQCGSQQSCYQSGGTAECRAWVCAPMQSYCVGSSRATCSADGLSVISSVDCAGLGQTCVNGTCQTQVCQPSQRFCQGNSIMQCDASGGSSTVVTTCPTGYSCSTATQSCVPQVCLPNQPVCNGNLATLCNADGTGYATGGTDCSLSGGSCSGGTCAAPVCPPTPPANGSSCNTAFGCIYGQTRCQCLFSMWSCV